jgi:hypothetical protein
MPTKLFEVPSQQNQSSSSVDSFHDKHSFSDITDHPVDALLETLSRIRGASLDQPMPTLNAA